MRPARSWLPFGVALVCTSACQTLFGIEGDRIYEGSGGAATNVASSAATGQAAAGGATGDGGRDAGGGETGGNSVSTSSTGGGGEGCPEVGHATDGPYGAALLYFGEPEVDASLPHEFVPNGELAVRSAGMSPDGLVLAARDAPARAISIRTRVDPFAAWSDPGTFVQDVVDVDPHLGPDGLALFACQGGEDRCKLLRRQEGGFFDSDFTDEGEAVFDFGPFAGATADLQGIDRGFVLTPDFRYLAFSSNRSASSTEANDGDDDPTTTDLWFARAVDPDDLPLGFEGLQRLDAASAPSGVPPNGATPSWPEESPEWLADDGATIVFHSGRNGDFDLFVTSGDPDDATFGAAQRITALSAEGEHDDSFTMPSLATLSLSCGRGYATFRRLAIDQFGGGDSTFYRVAVCAGAPCE